MKRRTVKVLSALAVAAVMLSGTANVRAEGSYTTKPGDSLQKIAKEVYGDSGKWNVIYEANKEQIKNPNKIWANQTFILPDAGSGTTDNSSQTTTETTDTTTSASDAAADASTFLQDVYHLMAAQDYAGMRAVDGSETANAFVSAMDSDRSVYLPDGSFTGTGAGIYKFGEGGYYFYYGDYVDGVRIGNGISFISGGNYIATFTGAWDNDAPNGQGTLAYVLDADEYGYSDTRTDSGSLVNGLWNGTVNITYTSSYNTGLGQALDTYVATYTADNGVATVDKTEEFLSHVQFSIENSGPEREEELAPEGAMCYAFTGDYNGVVINGVEQYYDDAFVRFLCYPGQRLGVFGWED